MLLSPALEAQQEVVAAIQVHGNTLTSTDVPILGAEDGYGLTYGAQVAFTGHRATRRRIVVPASWGGDKRIAAE